MSSKDGALQLLLIIDHIFDWARDIYRPAILRHLESLSADNASDTEGIAHDSDIFSLQNPIGEWINRTQSIAPSNVVDTSDFEATLHIDRPLRNLDSAEGVFRHASFVDSEFLGIHITRDNADTLLLLANTPKQAVVFARKLLKALLNRKSTLLTEETLIELEDMWTGGAPLFGNPVAPATEFVVRLLLNKSLSKDWNQVRELSYLAASQEGLDVLIRRSGLRRPSAATASACEKHSVKSIVGRHLSIPASRGLRAAIAREALSLESTVILDDGTITEGFVPLERRKDHTHGLIHEIYRKHKVGMREPDESFIRKSTRIDEQTLEEAPQLAYTLGSLNKRDPLDQYGNGLPQNVLVSGRCVQVLGSASGGPEICYYKVSGPPEAPKALDLRMALQQILRTSSRIYKTERYAKKSFSTKWNLNSFYDIYRPVTNYQRGKIDTWIAQLNRAGDRFDIPPSPPQSNLTTSSPSSAVRTGKRRIALVESELDAQGPKARNQSHSTPTGRRYGSATEKIQRRPMPIDLTEDDGPEVQPCIQDTRKRIRVQSKKVRRGKPSRSTHFGRPNAAPSGVMPRVRDQVEREVEAFRTAAYRKFDTRLFEDEMDQCLREHPNCRSEILGNDKGKTRAHDVAIQHDNRDAKAHVESSVSSTKRSGPENGDRSKLGRQPEHESGTHRRDENLPTEVADVVKALCAEVGEEISRAKKRIRTSMSSDSRHERTSGEVIEDGPVQLDRPPPSPIFGAFNSATPIFGDFNDMNGRWTYSSEDGGRFVRIT